MDRQALYASVTSSVVAQIEDGAGSWRMPWQAIAQTGQPVNALTHQPYRGGNHLVLGMVAVANGYSGSWATYKQWQQLGGQVRRGEKSTHGVKWSAVGDRRTREEGERLVTKREPRLVPFCF